MDHKVVVSRGVASGRLRRHQGALDKVQPLGAFERAGIDVPIASNDPWATQLGYNLCHDLKYGQVLFGEALRMYEP